MEPACSNGLQLFPDTNETREALDKLKLLQAAWEPYHGVLCLTICVFGLITNAINVVVLSKRQMRSSVNMILVGIALCDMGTMASYIVYLLHFVIQQEQCMFVLYSYPWILYLVVHMLVSNTLHATSLWLAVIMACLRTVTLRERSVTSKWMDVHVAKRLCTATFVIVQLFCVPMLFSNQIFDISHKVVNNTCGDRYHVSGSHEDVIGANSSRSVSKRVFTIQVSDCRLYVGVLWMNGIFFKTIPCIALSVFIGSLIHTVRGAKRRRDSLMPLNFRSTTSSTSAGLRRYDRTTVMLVAVLLMFLVSELPQGIVVLLSAIFVEDVQRHVLPNIGNFLDLLSLINSSVTFVLYCSMSDKFRQVFWQVLLPKRLYLKWYVRNVGGTAITRHRNRKCMQSEMTDLVPGLSPALVDGLYKNVSQQNSSWFSY